MQMAQNSAMQQTPDLTNLSLEQLLQEDIIPVNVLGTHTHLKGQVMLGYEFTHQNYAGNQQGTHPISLAGVLEKYPVAHTSMNMDMHMFELMYAPSDNLTLMAMLPYKSNVMEHLNRKGVHYLTSDSGIGDLQLQANITVSGDIHKGGSRLLFNAGISVPTGSIDERHSTPTSASAKLEYPMQLGIGTVALLPGLTYLNDTKRWSLGAQFLGSFPLGTNADHYRWGDAFSLDTWAYYRVSDQFGPSLRLDWSSWGNIHGADPEFHPLDNPAFDPKQQSGKRLSLYLGFSLYAPRGRLKGHRLTFEAGWPLYQDLGGIQIGEDFEYTLSWNYTFTP
ncbi:MAG TPA: transporter [Chthonomonadaceae bacterium]|nr:transporter [Chthonomonadaceae bacterium]